MENNTDIIYLNLNMINRFELGILIIIVLLVALVSLGITVVVAYKDEIFGTDTKLVEDDELADDDDEELLDDDDEAVDDDDEAVDDDDEELLDDDSVNDVIKTKIPDIANNVVISEIKNDLTNNLPNIQKYLYTVLPTYISNIKTLQVELNSLFEQYNLVKVTDYWDRWIPYINSAGTLNVSIRRLFTGLIDIFKKVDYSPESSDKLSKIIVDLDQLPIYVRYIIYFQALIKLINIAIQEFELSDIKPFDELTIDNDTNDCGKIMVLQQSRIIFSMYLGIGAECQVITDEELDDNLIIEPDIDGDNTTVNMDSEDPLNGNKTERYTSNRRIRDPFYLQKIVRGI